MYSGITVMPKKPARWEESLKAAGAAEAAAANSRLFIISPPVFTSV
jgi:hypothetical protein